MENTLYQSLVSVVHDNTLAPLLYKYRTLYKNEDYILIFYIMQMYERQTTLDKGTLESLIKVNAPKWLDRNSQIRREDPENLTKDYLQSQSQTTLLTSADEEEVLVELVINRYEDLLAVKPILEGEALEVALSNEFKGYVNDDIVKGLTKLIAGPIRYNKKTYTKSELVDYLRDKIGDIDVSLSQSDMSSYQTRLEEAYIEALENRAPCFRWNIGVDTIPVVKKSYMVSVIGYSKVGKTRFVIGEMVYPTLRRGGNVLILSGEMAKTDINSFIVIKHLYMNTGIRLGLENCNNILGLMAVLKAKGIRRSEIRTSIPPGMEMYERVIKKVRTIPEEVVEAVIATAHEVQGEKKFGVPFLMTKEDGIFNINSFLRDLKSAIVENDIDMVVIDHMGLIEPDSKLSKTETLTQAYQMAKQLSADKKHPVAVIAINHVDTSSEEKSISGNGDDIAATARAFNTNEAKKSADLELVLYNTSESKREGQVFLRVPYSRWEAAPDERIPLVSDYLTCDFVVPGIEKVEYETV